MCIAYLTHKFEYKWHAIGCTPFEGDHTAVKLAASVRSALLEAHISVTDVQAVTFDNANNAQAAGPGNLVRPDRLGAIHGLSTYYYN